MEAANVGAVESVQVGSEWYGTGAGRKVGLFWGGFMKPFWRLSMAVNPHMYGEREWRKQLTRSEKSGRWDKEKQKRSFVEEGVEMKKATEGEGEVKRVGESWSGKRSKKRGV